MKKNRILICCAFHIALREHLVTHLRKKGQRVDVFELSSSTLFTEEDTVKMKRRFDVNSLSPHLKVLLGFIGLRKVLSNKVYDTVNVQFVHPVYYFFFLTVKKRFNISLTFFGSDYNRSSSFSKWLMKPLLRIATKVGFTNVELQNRSSLFYKKKYDNKFAVVRFGLEPLEYIDKVKSEESKESSKKKLGFLGDQLIITCGYNATKEQRHELIIQAFSKIDTALLEKKNIVLVFPMQYGITKVERIKEVQKMLDVYPQIDAIIIDKFMKGEELARLRIASDIMINILTTDQFSGSMQEYIYAENLIITGNWLPYDLLLEEGVQLNLINDPSELAKNITNILESGTEKIAVNQKKAKEVIYKYSSWKNNIDSWISFYNN